MNEYEEHNRRRKKIVDNMPLHWAFGRQQFAEEMQKMGLDPDKDRDKVCGGPAGSFMLVSDVERVKRQLAELEVEWKDALASDDTGDGFIYQMFLYELKNHEYGYTGSVGDTLDALGFDWEEVKEDARLKHGLERACLEIRKASGW